MAKRRIRPDKAAASVGGDPGWYAGIPVNSTGWPKCVNCGVKVSIVDHRTGECLRCKMAAKAQARKQEAAG